MRSRCTHTFAPGMPIGPDHEHRSCTLPSGRIFIRDTARIQWHKVHWITMKTCRISCENACRKGVRNSLNFPKFSCLFLIFLFESFQNLFAHPSGEQLVNVIRLCLRQWYVPIFLMNTFDFHHMEWWYPFYQIMEYERVMCNDEIYNICDIFVIGNSSITFEPFWRALCYAY